MRIVSLCIKAMRIYLPEEILIILSLVESCCLTSPEGLQNGCQHFLQKYPTPFLLVNDTSAMLQSNIADVLMEQGGGALSPLPPMGEG